MSTFNLNTSELTILSNKLDRIGRSELPLAIRGTLNDMAFKMKGYRQRGEIDKMAEKSFDYKRDKNFIKSMSGAEKATGFNTKKMVSKAGIIKTSGKNKVAEGLFAQETGNDINKKTTPLDGSRTAKNRSKKVGRQSRLRNLNPIDARELRKNKFIAKAISSKNKKRMLLVKGSGTDLIGRVRTFKRKKGTVDIKIEWLYRVADNINIKLKKRPFIKKAAKNVGKDMDKIFVENANKRLNKIK